MNNKSPKRTLTQADADFLQKQFSKVFATKKDISSLKTDVSSLKSIVNTLPTKKDVENIVLDAINTVIIPGMDDMYSRLTSELASKEQVKELSLQIDSLDRKFDSQQMRQDRHDNRIEKLEKIHPNNAHLAVV